MYLDTCKVRSGNKVYTRVLLRESYREDGKVKHRTIANLSKCSEQEIADQTRLAPQTRLSRVSGKCSTQPQFHSATGLKHRRSSSPGGPGPGAWPG